MKFVPLIGIFRRQLRTLFVWIRIRTTAIATILISVIQ